MTRRIVFITTLFCLSTSFLYAQQEAATGSVKGRITDTSSHSLSGATITLISAKDTTKAQRMLSNAKGEFLFKQVTPGLYDLRISYLGYELTNNFVGITSRDLDINTGDIQMHQTYNENATVVVSATIPTSLKNDTIAFSANNFGTKPNATVEDLLKKLPGVEVDNNGVITAQGEQVTRVFVDGKRFFGSDPKLAVENLPRDIVEKIEVFDGKSDQSELTGFDDGTRIKTINIVTKPSRKYGWFGRSSVAVGNDTASLKQPLYDIEARVFHFDGDLKFGVTGMLNNVNNGLAKAANANIFFGDSLKLMSKKVKTDFSGNYYVNNTNTNLLQNSIKQNFYSDTSLNTNSFSADTSRSLTQSHAANLNFDTKFDSLNELRIRPSISFNNSDSRSLSTTEIDSLAGIAIPKNSTYADRSNHNSNTNVNVSATYWHGFKKKGRAITLDMQYSAGANNSNGNNFSRMSFFGNAPDSLINQRNETDGNNHSLSSTLTYTEPVGKYQMMKLQYNNSFSQYNSDRKTFNFDSTTDDYTIPNIGLTNDFKNIFSSNRAEIGYMYNHDKLNFNISGGIQFGEKEGNNVSKDYTITDNYTNFYPTAGLIYNFSRTQKLILRYDGRTNQPAISQLQPVVDSSNILNITSGNPDLKQNFTNHFQLMYNKIANGGGRSLFVFLDASFINDDIVNSITHLNNGGQFTMPVNMNGDYTLHGALNFNVPLPLPKSNFEFRTDLRNGRSASLVDSSANFTYNTNLSESIHWSTAMDKLFDIDFAFTPAYNITSYSVDDGNSNSNYYSQSTSFNGTWYTGSGWELTSGFDYTFYKGDAPGQNISIPLWSAAIIKRIFKDKSGEISLAVHDILDENKGVSFVRNENYSQQITSNILKRYALLSFTYNLHKFGVKRDSHELKSWREKYEDNKD